MKYLSSRVYKRRVWGNDLPSPPRSQAVLSCHNVFLTVVLASLALLFLMFVRYRTTKFSLFFKEDLHCMKNLIDKKIAWAEEFFKDNMERLRRAHANRESKPIDLCIGIMTTRRAQSSKFLTLTMASLLDSLSPEEHDRVKIIIANTEASSNVHNEAYQFSEIVDVRTKYNIQLEHREPPKEENITGSSKDAYGKQTRDYVFMLKQCLGESKFTVILEDDVYTQKGFLPKLEEALGSISDQKDWIFLKLFFSEDFLGWSNDDILLVFSIVFFVVGIAFSIFSIILKLNTPPWLAIVLYYIAVFTFTSLYIVGKQNVVYSHGIHGVTEFTHSCCSPAHVYPTALVPSIITYLEDHASGNFFVDLLLDSFAESHNFKRYLLKPNLFQHTGLKTNFALDPLRHFFIWSRDFDGDLYNDCIPKY